MSLDTEIAGNTDPTPGENGGESGDHQPAERTYTQRDVDSQLAAARRSFEYESSKSYERRLQEARAEWERANRAAPTPESSPFDPQVEAALAQWFQRQIQPIIGPITEGQVRSQVEIGLSQFESRHPELSKAEVNDILETALSFGDDIVNKAPLDWLLDQARLRVKFANFDEKAFAKKAVDEWRASKSKVAAVPTPQGPGSALTTQRRPKSFKDADKAFEAMLERADNE